MKRPEGYGWPAWSTPGGDHLWTDANGPWISREAIMQNIEQFKREGGSIICNGIWRIKEWRGDKP